MGAASGDPGGGEMPMMKNNPLQFMKSPFKPLIRLSVLGVVVSKYNTKNINVYYFNIRSNGDHLFRQGIIYFLSKI